MCITQLLYMHTLLHTQHYYVVECYYVMAWCITQQYMPHYVTHKSMAAFYTVPDCAVICWVVLLA